MVEVAILKQAQAEAEFEKKMRLERRMLPSIRSTFSKMVREYVDQLSAIGTIPQASDFNEEWRVILREQYRRVGREFLNTQRSSKFYPIILERKQSVLTLGQIAELSTGFSTWSRQFGIDQSLFISDTNQAQYNDALRTANEQAQEQFEEDGTQLSTAAIAALAGVALRKLFKAREATIANVQTQAPAEEAKRREAVSVAGAEGRPAEVIEKVWQTVGDEKVRPAHVLANGQKRTENAAFNVGGDQLMYPGDSQLGASIKMTINCRCAAIYGASDDSIKPKPFERPIPSDEVEVEVEVDRVRINRTIQTVEEAKPKKPVEKIKRSKKPLNVDTTNRVDNRPDHINVSLDKKLSSQEEAVLESYKGSVFYKNNEILRNKSAFDGSQVKSAQDFRDHLNSAVNKSVIKDNGTLYRGLKSSDLFENAESLIGKEIPILTPQSTARTASAGAGWSGLWGNPKKGFLSADRGKSVIFKINVKKGQKALDMETLKGIGNTDEKEILLPSGGKYRVKSVRDLITPDGKSVAGKVIEVDYDE